MKPNWTRLRHGYGVASSCKVGKGWTPGETSCSVSRMWKTFAALVLLATPALAQERITAYDALRVVGVHVNREAVNHVISVTGTKGDPQPETWRILLDDRAHGGIREIQVRNGRVASERPSSVVGSSEGATINTSRLNLDSSGAFQVASHIGANHGNVTRTEGMFAGATMQDVATEQRVYRERPRREEGAAQASDEDEDNDHGPLYGVRQRMRGYFDRAQDEAGGMFDRVKRSFSDFIN